jgi:hypothetical protein
VSATFLPAKTALLKSFGVQALEAVAGTCRNLQGLRRLAFVAMTAHGTTLP